MKCRYSCFNSLAVRWDSWVSTAIKSIFRGDPIFELVALFFVIILKFIFVFIFEIKNHEKKYLGTKKFHFRRSIHGFSFIYFSFIISKFLSFNVSNGTHEFLPAAQTISNPDSVGVKLFFATDCSVFFIKKMIKRSSI